MNAPISRMSGARKFGAVIAVLVGAIAVVITYLLHDIQHTYQTVVPPSSYYRQQARHVYQFNVTKITLNRFGVPKQFVTVNNKVPGPPIYGNVGDTVAITVRNQLPDGEGVSLHWHGIEHHGTNVMDGAAGVTQCAIPPGGELNYTFKLTQSGTFWWHGHMHGHRIDGLYGALVVEGDDDHYRRQHDYDDDVVVFVSDYYLEPFRHEWLFYTSPLSQGLEPMPDGGVINGYGVFNCSNLLLNKHLCDSALGRYSEFFLHPNKKYRLRIINTSAIAHYEFSIDHHYLHVVEADSTEIQPVNMHYLPIGSGQRYSAIINTGSKKASDFFMRARMNPECLNGYNRQLELETRAIVRYHDKQVVDHLTYLVKRKWNGAQVLPKTTPWEDTIPENVCEDVATAVLVPVQKQCVPDADKRVILFVKNVRLERRDRAPFAFVNRTSWIPAIGAPNVHVAMGLVNASETVQTPTIHGGKNTPKWGGDQLIVEVQLGQVVEIIVNNLDESPHPFHLHGHRFWLVDMYAPPNKNGAWIEDQIEDYVLDNPILRDTVTVPRFGNMVLRFVADKPGIWAFHCHMEWHMSTGMLMQFAVGMDKFNETIPEIMAEHCRIERERGAELLMPLPGYRV